MCIKVGCGARAGWTPSAACPGCPLVKAIRARQGAAKDADSVCEQPAAAIAVVQDFLRSTGLRRAN